MKKPVSWGVLGVADHYRLRVSNPLAHSEIVNVTGIASRNSVRAQEAAQEFGIPKAFGSYEDLLKDDEIEAVYIPLPNHLHTEWVKKAADYGKHILCEKPFSMNAAETAEAVEYARKKGVLVMEAFMYKLHPKWRHARNQLKVGEIGELQAVQTFFSYALFDPENIRNKLETGGGAIPDIGCYAVSSARFLTGKEPARVLSLVHRDPNLGTDILSSAILDFGTLRAVFTVGTQTFPHQKVEVFGSGGNITIENPFNIYPDVPGKVTIQNGVGTRHFYSEIADQYGIEFEEFSLAVRGEGPLPIDPEDAVLNQKVLDALFESEKRGTWVPV